METAITGIGQQAMATSQNSHIPAGIDFFNPACIENVTKLSTLFANSSLVPESYRIGGVVGGKTGEGPKKTVSEQEAVANCVIALDVASRIGASPLMVMQNLYIVYGKPSWSSKFLIATINTCGRFEPLKFELTSAGVTTDGKPNVKCVAWTTPKGVTRDEDGRPLTYKSQQALRGTSVTIQMAIDEGWYNKNGSKWRTMPELMLRYRAASFWTSTYAPDVSMGMRTVEETIEEAEYTDVTELAKQEITEKAGRKKLTMDDTDLQNAQVDTSTGEILQPQGEQPQAKAEVPQQEEEGPGY